MAQESSPNLSGSTGRQPAQVNQNKAFGNVEDKPVALFLLLLNAVFTASGIYVRSGSMPDGSCSLTADNPVFTNFSGSNMHQSLMTALYVLPMVFFTITVFASVFWDIIFKKHCEKIQACLFEYVAVPMDKYCEEKSMLVIMVVTLCFLASVGLLLPLIVVSFPITLLIAWIDGIYKKNKNNTYCANYAEDKPLHTSSLCECNSNCLIYTVKYLVIWVAGTLYLAGDNLLLIAEEVDGELEVSGFPARELRSYIISYALIIYILKDEGISFIEKYKKHFSNEKTESNGPPRSSNMPCTNGLNQLSKKQRQCLKVVQVLKQWCQLIAVAVPIDGVFTTIKDTITPNIQTNGLCMHDSSQKVNISAAQCEAANATAGYFGILAYIWILLVTAFLVYTWVKLCCLQKKHNKQFEGPTACFLAIAVGTTYGFIIVCIPAFVAADNSFPWVVYAVMHIMGDSNSICHLAQARIAILFIVAVIVNFFLNVVICLAVLEHAILAFEYVQKRNIKVTRGNSIFRAKYKKIFHSSPYEYRSIHPYT